MLNRNIIKRYIFLCLSLSVAAVIFWLSHQTATVSSEESEGLIWRVLNLIPHFARMADSVKYEIIDGIHTLVRKTAHFGIYAALGFCVFNYILTYISARKKAVLTSALICFLYACSDEFHQLFIEGRSGELRDVFIDTCGAVTGICCVLVIMRVICKVRRCKG